jgi:hypothetical protein
MKGGPANAGPDAVNSNAITAAIAGPIDARDVCPIPPLCHREMRGNST